MDWPASLRSLPNVRPPAIIKWKSSSCDPEKALTLLYENLRTPRIAMPPIANPARSSPLGATIVSGGVNFSVFSRNAAAMELLLFDREDDDRPAQIVPLDPRTSRSYHYWHAFIPGLQPGQLYGYRARGQFEPSRGMRFDPGKVLLDPYGRGV